jgi:hypothetical protein
MTTIPDQTNIRDIAQQAQFTTYDYGRVGDQRPYQVVMPSYEAPQFLKTFMNLHEGLRECLTLCSLQGRPFRLMRWGARNPCIPCKQRFKGGGRLPSFVRSPGALKGYPEARPIMEAHPTKGVSVFGPRGEVMKPGGANYRVSEMPWIDQRPRDLYNPGPVNLRYLQAVQTAQEFAGRSGKRAYVCSSLGADCKGRKKQWFPVVYADPGGLVARYSYEEDFGAGTVPGSTSVSTDVGPDSYRELLLQSEGATRLAQGH